MSLSIDGSALSNFSSTSSHSISLTTTNANDIIVLYIGYENQTSAAPTVSNVSDTAGLAWHRRGGATGKTGITTGPNNSVIDVWWAYSSGVLTADSITVTLSGSIDDGALVAFGVSGVPSSAYTAPWDSNASLPKDGIKTVAASSSMNITGVSTNSAAGMLLGFCGNSVNSQNSVSQAAGWTQIQNGLNSGGSLFWTTKTAFDNYTSALSNATETPYNNTGTQSQDLIFYLDALVAVAAAITGSAADTIADLISNASGTVIVSGSSVETISPFVSAATGNVIVIGNAADIIGPFVSSATGSVSVGTIIGTAANIISPLISAATGNAIVTGTANDNIADFVSVASGSIPPIGGGQIHQLGFMMNLARGLNRA